MSCPIKCLVVHLSLINSQNFPKVYCASPKIMIYLTKWGECAMADELFTVAQAAEYLKVCDKTVRRMIASKELVASKVGSRSWRIRKDDIDAYLNATSTGQEGADTIE